VGYNLFLPVKRFCHDFVKGLLVGTGPRHLACAIAHFARDSSAGAASKFFGVGASKLELGDLTQLVYDDRFSSGALNQARIAKSTVLTKNMMTAVGRWGLMQQLDAAIEVMNARQQMYSLLHATTQWYYQELLPGSCKLAEPSRVKFLPGITNKAARVYKLQTELSNLMVGLIDLRNVVDQRLRWAVGANSQLQDVVDQFSAQHTNQIENAKHAGQLVRAVTGIVEAAVQYELLRTKTPEAQASDHQFLNILTMARESAGLRQMQKASGLSEEEMSLLDMNPPAGPIDRFWIRQTEDIIASTVRSIQDQVSGTNKHCTLALRRLSDSASCIKDLLTVHHRHGRRGRAPQDHPQDRQPRVPRDSVLPYQIQGVHRGAEHLGPHPRLRQPLHRPPQHLRRHAAQGQAGHRLHLREPRQHRRHCQGRESRPGTIEESKDQGGRNKEGRQ